MGNYHGSFVGNFHARGIASNPTGTEIWYILSDGIVINNLADGSNNHVWVPDNLSKPEGIATDGQDIWIVDKGTDKVYFYDQGAEITEFGTYGETSSFSLANGNGNPRGITTDGEHLWVVNSKSKKDEVFKYTTSGTLVGQWTIDSVNVNPRGITIDPNDVDHLWIVDSTTDSVYQYSGAASRTSGSQSADSVFALTAENSNPQGIADPPPPGLLPTVNSSAITIPVAEEFFATADWSMQQFSSFDTKATSSLSRTRVASERPMDLNAVNIKAEVLDQVASIAEAASSAISNQDTDTQLQTIDEFFAQDSEELLVDELLDSLF